MSGNLSSEDMVELGYSSPEDDSNHPQTLHKPRYAQAFVTVIIDDLVQKQELVGSEFIYQKDGDKLVAAILDSDGNEIARLRVRITLDMI